MSKIIPAIMPKDLPDIDDHVYDVAGIVNWVQIDVMDGKFVPAKTWPYAHDTNFIDLKEQTETLPSWESIEYELDMMVEKPMEKLSEWASVGISRAIIHAESVNDLSETVKEFSENYRIPDSPIGMELMLAVPFDADPELISDVADSIDGVQVMGISPVGVQGSEFKEQALETIKEFRTQYPNLDLSVDGGVKEDLLEALFDAGVDRVVMGSAVYGAEDIRGNLKEMLSKI